MLTEHQYSKLITESYEIGLLIDFITNDEHFLKLFNADELESMVAEDYYNECLTFLGTPNLGVAWLKVNENKYLDLDDLYDRYKLEKEEQDESQ